MVGIMAITPNSRREDITLSRVLSDAWLVVKSSALWAVLMAVCSIAYAGDWTFTPSIQLSEIYTDNVRLAPPDAAKSDAITEVAPAIGVHGEGRRVTLDGNYRVQGLLYANESSLNHVYQQLNGKAQSELVRNYLFMDADANIGQQPFNPATTFAGGSLARPGLQTNVYRYRVSPYFKHDFGGAVTALARYSYSTIRYSQGAAANANDNRVDIDLASGRRFTRLIWNARYYDERLTRTNVKNVNNKSAVGTARYGLTNSWSALARVGYERHDFPTTGNRGYKNGSYWAAGLGWRPNRHLSIDALYGDRYKSVAGNWAPTARTALHITWVNRDVGVNPGHMWNGSFTLKTRRTTWSASYLEDTTSYQQLIALGTYYVDPVTGQTYVTPPSGVFTVPVDLFAPTNEVFTRKRGQASMGIHTRRTDALFTVYSERRDYLVSLNSQRVSGLSASWNWRFAGRTTLVLAGDARRTRLLTTGGQDDLWYALTGLKRSLSPKADLSLTYRYTTLNSSLGTNDYRENRVTLTLNKRF
jgi:hypothetical protein